MDRQNWQPASALDDLIAPAHSARGNPEPVEQAVGTVVPAGQLAAPSGISMPGANWHYNIGGELHGPVSIMELRSMMSAAKLHPNDYVWKEGMPDWLPVSQIPELQLTAVSAPAAAGYAPLHDDGIQHTSGLAVASLVMGIVGLVTPFFVFNLLATIFGAAALKAIARSRITLGGRGMALSGLILGIVGLIFWVIFVLFWFGFLASFIAAAGIR